MKGKYMKMKHLTNTKEFYAVFLDDSKGLSAETRAAEKLAQNGSFERKETDI